MLVITASLVIAIACAVPQIEPLPIDLDFGGGMTTIASLALAEAAHVWAPYRIAIHRAGTGGVEPIVVRVTVTDRAPSTAPDRRAIGSIEFRDGLPVPVIALYKDRALEVICAVAGAAAEHWPVSYRELVLGRVLGRALAHELGHFVLQSREHSSEGLMRASQSMVDLMSADKTGLFLTPADVKRLAAAPCHPAHSR